MSGVIKGVGKAVKKVFKGVTKLAKPLAIAAGIGFIGATAFGAFGMGPMAGLMGTASAAPGAVAAVPASAVGTAVANGTPTLAAAAHLGSSSAMQALGGSIASGAGATGAAIAPGAGGLAPFAGGALAGSLAGATSAATSGGTSTTTLAPSTIGGVAGKATPIATGTSASTGGGLSAWFRNMPDWMKYAGLSSAFTGIAGLTQARYAQSQREEEWRREDEERALRQFWGVTRDEADAEQRERLTFANKDRPTTSIPAQGPVPVGQGMDMFSNESVRPLMQGPDDNPFSPTFGAMRTYIPPVRVAMEGVNVRRE